jgi:hypothetical protein
MAQVMRLGYPNWKEILKNHKAFFILKKLMLNDEIKKTVRPHPFFKPVTKVIKPKVPDM